jgi:mRNA interferase MazF
MTRSGSGGIARFEVVVVPFPFTDRAAAKRRPALVLSSADTFNRAAGHSVMAMITSAAGSTWPLDVALSDLTAAGLPSASIVRMKLFTLDHRFVLRRAGRLAPRDATAVEASLAALLSAVSTARR